MAIELDNYHYDYRAIDGYNKPFNFIASPRELGKTSMMWMKKIYLPWKRNHKPWIYLVRQSVEITSALIDSIKDTTINKFTDDNVEFVYKTSAFKDGIVDVFIVLHHLEKVKVTSKDEKGEMITEEIEQDIPENVIFFRIVSLNIMLRRIKHAVLKDIAGVFIDVVDHGGKGGGFTASRRTGHQNKSALIGTDLFEDLRQFKVFDSQNL